MSGYGAKVRESRLEYGAIGIIVVLCVEILTYCAKLGPLGIFTGAAAATILLLLSWHAEFYNDL